MIRMPKITSLTNKNFSHVLPRELGTAKGATTYGKPLSPELKKKIKELKQKRET